MKKEVLILIPAYNEKETIGNLIQSIRQSGCEAYSDVIVVNDASSDGTNMICKRMGIPVITHTFNLGYGAALQIGYKYAVRYGYQYVIQIDADGQHDIANIGVIYQKLKNSDRTGKSPDLVIGSRFLEGSESFPVSGIKMVAIHFFRRLIRMLGKGVITDPTSGLQGLNRKTFLYYSKFGNFDCRYPDSNMLIQMLLLGYEIQEVPAIMHSREHGESMHSGLKPVFYMIEMFISSINVWLRCKKGMYEERR